jgi:peptidyl-prolyl cis-trans isomerase B (cyclophilin B)
VNRRLLALPALIAGLLTGLLTACGGGSSSPGTAVTRSVEASSSAVASGCSSVAPAQGSPQNFPNEPAVSVRPGTYTATVETNCGTIVASLDATKAPHTVNSFAFLAGKHYFDGTICHRLVTQGIHVLQCGDPTGSGSGGPGYTIPDENLAGATYPTGTLAMANTGQPHTGGSQFFFVYAETPLPPQYTPFGKVTTGLDVLQRIAAAGDDESNGSGDGKPKQPVVIKSFTVQAAN